MKSNKPLITVLIPSLNSQDYIKQCVDSVCNQTLEDIEILCIDAGSTDNTLNILNQLAINDSRISILHSDRKSYGFQMNMGLDNTNGKYVSIVESDDYIDKDMLKVLYDLAEDNCADISKTTFYHVYNEETEEKLVIDDSKQELADVENPFNLNNQPIFLRGHPSIWAAIYRTDWIKENNIRFIEEKGAGWVDNPFFYETAFSANNIVYKHAPYYYYRESNPNSSSNNLTDFTIPIKRMMDNLDIVDKYKCSDELVLKEVYIRGFAYINNIFRKDGYIDYMDILRPLIQEMLLRFDENIVLKHLSNKKIDMYYKYISPLKLIGSNENGISISKKDYELIVKENNYLYSRLDHYKDNKIKTNKKIKSARKEIKSIKDSKAYKFALLLTKPFR